MLNQHIDHYTILDIVVKVAMELMSKQYNIRLRTVAQSWLRSATHRYIPNTLHVRTWSGHFEQILS